MNSQKGIVGCLLLACTLQMSAQVKTYKYRVNFRDKAETAYALDKPSAYLSERALERRMKQGLPVDSTDIPVCRSYIDMLVGKGAQLVSKSKWNNTVVVQVSDTSVIDKVAALSRQSSRLVLSTKVQLSKYWIRVPLSLCLTA